MLAEYNLKCHLNACQCPLPKTSKPCNHFLVKAHLYADQIDRHSYQKNAVLRQFQLQREHPYITNQFPCDLNHQMGWVIQHSIENILAFRANLLTDDIKKLPKHYAHEQCLYYYQLKLL